MIKTSGGGKPTSAAIMTMFPTRRGKLRIFDSNHDEFPIRHGQIGENVESMVIHNS